MKNASKLTVALVIIFCALLCTFFFVQANSYKQNFDVLQEGVEKLQKANEELSNTNKNLIESNEKLQQKIDVFTEQLKENQEEINDLKKENSDLKKQLQAKATRPNLPDVASNPNSSVSGERIAYLTFDDGPSKNTVSILDTLKRYNVKGTFFVVGKTDEFSTNIYKRIHDEGHSLGNHTYSHNYSNIYKSIDAYKQDTYKLERLLHDVTGVKPSILRFPGGSNNQVSWNAGGKGVMNKITTAMVKDGYQYFDWNVDSKDAEAVTQDKSVIINSILKEAQHSKRAIVLMHDSSTKTTTAQALPEVIEGLQEMGFKFDVLDKNSSTVQFTKP